MIVRDENGYLIECPYIWMIKPKKIFGLLRNNDNVPKYRSIYPDSKSRYGRSTSDSRKLN